MRTLLLRSITVTLFSTCLSTTGLKATEPIPAPSDESQILFLWADDLRKHIKKRIVFNTEGLTDNPEVIYIVDLSTSGQIMGLRLLSSSSNQSWDEAVLRAIAESSPLPRKRDGGIETRLMLAFRPIER